MTIFNDFGFREGRAPLARARGFAFEQLVSIHDTTLEMRWAMVQLAWRSFTAMCAFMQEQLFSKVRKVRAPRPEGRGEHCCC
jgi:hypothetical protein